MYDILLYTNCVRSVESDIYTDQMLSFPYTLYYISVPTLYVLYVYTYMLFYTYTYLCMECIRFMHVCIIYRRHVV